MGVSEAAQEVIISTESELLFERFCAAADIPFTAIPVEDAAGQKTPDYELHLQQPPILAEIKQIDPNAADEAMERQLGEGDVGFAFRGIPGTRLRLKISQAAKQIRASARSGQPGILVVFNNVSVIRGLTDPLNVMAALYGTHEFVLAVSRERGGRAEFIDRRLGGKQTVTPTHNTSLSAVAVVFEGSDGPYLVLYHNHFAANPIEPTILRRPRILQFKLTGNQPGEFPKWESL